MPPVSGHKKLAEAVFTSISEGTYAAEQDVASAELQSTALGSLSALLEQARTDVKNNISELSRLSATDIDGWIVQAKQLREDITRSEQQSKDIVSFADGGRGLQEEAQDALAKVRFLEDEVAFNDNLVRTLEDVQSIKAMLDDTDSALKSSQLFQASRLLEQASDKSRKLRPSAGTTAIQVLHGRRQAQQTAILEAYESYWNKLIIVDKETRRLTIHQTAEVSCGNITLEEVARAMLVLDPIQNKIAALVTSIDEDIIHVLLQNTHGKARALAIHGQDTIKVVDAVGVDSIGNAFQDIILLQKFGREQVPDAIWSPLGVQLIRRIVDSLLSSTLVKAIPPDLSGLQVFQHTIEDVKTFARWVEEQDIPSSKKLLDWAADAPNLWLAKHSEGSLNSIRQLLKRGLGQPRQVERVETQMVKDNDQMLAANGSQDDWNAGWSDDEEPQEPNAAEEVKNALSRTNKNAATADEDEDISGWGFDNDDDEGSKSPTKPEQTSQNPEEEAKLDDDDGDGGDAWGWQDEPESPNELRFTQSPQTPRAQTIHESSAFQQENEVKPQEREITLRETYHVTALPEQILDIIVMVIEDADSLSNANSSSPIASAAAELYLLPGFLLSMYRASAPTFYSGNVNGTMFLYNDCLYLSDRLCLYIKHRQSRQMNIKSLRALTQTDMPDLETFGKRAYGRDMESKRTTLIDLLDGAQGFAHSTQEPFASQCDLAISSVIDYLRQIHDQWSKVLSQSALLQSIGSLLTTITNKMIIDIEDMSDISEPESQRLVGFCKSITTLEDLFLPPSESVDNDETGIPLTAAYAKTWLRFQYLSNILDASLADIKYLWLEGELSLEFSVDEVVDLIEALFADSDHRKRAIAEIRRSR